MRINRIATVVKILKEQEKKGAYGTLLIIIENGEIIGVNEMVKHNGKQLDIKATELIDQPVLTKRVHRVKNAKK